MIYLIMYDITDSNLRTKIANLLIKEGAERIQFSVFITPFNPFKGELYNTIDKWMDKNTDDKFFITPILKRNFYKTKIIGKLDKDLERLGGDYDSLLF